MSKKPLTILAITAGHNRICYVFAVGEQPMDWQMSFRAVTTKETARAKVIEWINYYQPDVVLTLMVTDASRKGQRTQDLVHTARQTAEGSNAQSSEIQPQQPFENKYEQITHLCQKYPQLKAISVKTRKYWEKENPRVLYFEAVAMIDSLYQK